LKFRLIVVSISVVFVILILSSVVYAPLATLSIGYAVTSNYEGVDVPVGAEVIIKALTIDPNVDRVTFRWHEPPDGNGDVAREVTVYVVDSGEDYEMKDGTKVDIFVAEDSYCPLVIGDWGVQAFFQDGGTTKSGIDDVVSIKARSFNSVPEIPLGTIGAVAAMIIALGLFAIKKKRTARAANK
jgi:hypothetical protein